MFLGQILEGQDRHTEAAAIFLYTVQRDPNNVVALISLAEALAGSGHPDAAIAACRKALSLDPGNATAHRDLAMLLVGQHQNQQALAEAAEAVRLEPSVASNHMIYGKALAMVGRQAEADQQFAAAHGLDADSTAGADSPKTNH